MSIAKGECTPFLGAGVHEGRLPLASDLARSFAHAFEYPFEDVENLQRVTQFIASVHGIVAVKEMMLDALKLTDSLTENSDDPVSILAELPFPIYMTTNYDSLLTDCLRRNGKKARSEYCRWKDRSLRSLEKTTINEQPSIDSPLVFHWHGNADDLPSIVLTEDDYIDFLVALTSNGRRLLPPLIRQATGDSVLLIIGYRFADINMRVVMRTLNMRSNESNVFVRYLPKDKSLSLARARAEERELTRYLGGYNTTIFYGSAYDFAVELRDRWSQRSKKRS